MAIDSVGGRLTKQGNSMLRFLWCEAAIHAARRDPALARFYRRKRQQKELGKARVAVARKLGIRLWVLLRGDVVAVVTGKMNRPPASREREFARVIMVRCDRRDVWWAPPGIP